MTTWYGLGAFCGIWGYHLAMIGRPNSFALGATANLAVIAVFLAGVLMFPYYLRLESAKYRFADAHMFALVIGVATPYPCIASLFAAYHFWAPPRQLLFAFFLAITLPSALLAGEITVRYCRWRKLPHSR